MLRNLIQGSCASHNHDRVASMNDNESDSKPEIADEKGIKSSKPYHEPKFCSKERQSKPSSMYVKHKGFGGWDESHVSSDVVMFIGNKKTLKRGGYLQHSFVVEYHLFQ